MNSQKVGNLIFVHCNILKLLALTVCFCDFCDFLRLYQVSYIKILDSGDWMLDSDEFGLHINNEMIIVLMVCWREKTRIIQLNSRKFEKLIRSLTAAPGMIDGKPMI